MSSFIRQPDLTFELYSDVYKIKRRPSSSQLIINNNYQGISIIDPYKGSIVENIDFGSKEEEFEIIENWCFSSEGKQIIIFHEDNNAASWLDIEGDKKFSCLSPPGIHFTDLRYTWSKGSLWITSGNTGFYFGMEYQRECPVIVSRDSSEVKSHEPLWHKGLSKVPRRYCSVLDVDPENLKMFYFQSLEESNNLGIVDWGCQKVSCIEMKNEILSASVIGKLVFVLCENQVFFSGLSGEIKLVSDAPDGFSYLDLDVIPAFGNMPPILALLSTPDNGDKSARLEILSLEKAI